MKRYFSFLLLFAISACSPIFLSSPLSEGIAEDLNSTTDGAILLAAVLDGLGQTENGDETVFVLTSSNGYSHYSFTNYTSGSGSNTITIEKGFYIREDLEEETSTRAEFDMDFQSNRYVYEIRVKQNEGTEAYSGFHKINGHKYDVVVTSGEPNFSALPDTVE